MLERLGPDTELHVIDPVPEFDPGRAREAVPGPLHLPPRREPQRAADAARGRRRAHRRRPQLVHRVPRAEDARRDRTPRGRAAARADHARRAAGRTAAATSTTCPSACPRSSASRTSRRASGRDQARCSRRAASTRCTTTRSTEGGPRNGVMTALDDFVAEYDRPLRVRRAARSTSGSRSSSRRRASTREPDARARCSTASSRPRARTTCSRSRSRPASRRSSSSTTTTTAAATCVDRRRRPLPRPARRRRCSTSTTSTTSCASSTSRAASSSARRRERDEARRPGPRDAAEVGPARRGAACGRAPRPRPRRLDPPVHRHGPGAARPPARVPRRSCARDTSPGDLVECGHRPRRRRDLHARLPRSARDERARACGSPTGSGVDERRRTIPVVGVVADLNTVRDGFARFGLLDDRVRFLQGPPADTLPDAPIKQVALAAHRRRATAPTLAAVLDALYDRLAPDGVRDRRRLRRRPSAAPAVDAFRAAHGDRRAARARRQRPASAWRKTRAALPRGAADPRSSRRSPPPSAAACPPRRPARARAAAPITKDLSVVVVFYNMRARRRARCTRSRARTSATSTASTTRSSSSRTAPRPSRSSARSTCAASGPSSATSTSATDATPDPGRRAQPRLRDRGRPHDRVHDRRRPRADAERAALRHGRARDLRARDRRDPAVVRRPRPAARRDARPATTRRTRTSCSARSSGRVDGYRLFDIGHFIGDRDWFDGLWESNCIFVPRKLLEQYGAFDESFDDARRRLREPRALRAARRARPT